MDRAIVFCFFNFIDPKMNEINVIQNMEKAHHEFLNALLKGNHSSCRDLVDSYQKKHISIQELYENIFRNSLYEVGDLWEYNKISVATEHLASAIVESILNELYKDIVVKEKGSKKVITTCVENEHHQIGIRMVSDIFEMHGWQTYFLGSNTPNAELIDLIELIKPDIIAVSLSLYFNLPKLDSLLKVIHDRFPDSLVLVGGQAFKYGGLDLLNTYQNVIFKPDLKSIEMFIKNFK